jgi:hypothetical protein
MCVTCHFIDLTGGEGTSSSTGPSHINKDIKKAEQEEEEDEEGALA